MKIEQRGRRPKPERSDLVKRVERCSIKQQRDPATDTGRMRLRKCGLEINQGEAVCSAVRDLTEKDY
jgi:hypothetical protein